LKVNLNDNKKQTKRSGQLLLFYRLD